MLKAQRYRNRSTQCVDAPTATVISSVQKNTIPGTFTIYLNKYIDICIHVYLYAFIQYIGQL